MCWFDGASGVSHTHIPVATTQHTTLAHLSRGGDIFTQITLPNENILRRASRNAESRRAQFYLSGAQWLSRGGRMQILSGPGSAQRKSKHTILL